MSSELYGASERAARIRLLGTRLAETEAELQALTAGELDAVLDSSGTPLLLRAAQEALRETETRSRELIEALPIIACELGGDGTVRSVNRAVTSILGFTPEEIVGRRWWEVVGDGAIPIFPPRDGTGEAEASVRARDGSMRTILWSFAARRASGDRQLLFGVDITGRKLAEEAERRLLVERAARAEAEAAERRMALLSEASRLLATSLRYEATLTSIGRLTVTQIAEYCMVDVVEPDGSPRRIDAANPDPRVADPVRDELARRAPGDSRNCLIADVIGTGAVVSVDALDMDQAQSLVGAEHAAALVGRSLISAPLATRGTSLGAITLLGYSGGEAYAESDRTLVQEIASRAALAVDNARLYEAALTASKAKSEFLAVMSHELRTPLNAILGYVDLLLLGVPKEIPTESAAQVERMRLAARHLLQMIEEVLTLTRLDAGKERIQRVQVELCDFVEETAALVEPLAVAKQLQFECHPPEERVHVWLDLRKTRQILLNLLGNAVKFTREGQVALKARVDGPLIRFEVVDSGIGVAPEDRERIFEAFWQVERSHSRPSEGAGLGLSVTRRLARLLGGDVEVATGENGGSRSTVTLPGTVR